MYETGNPVPSAALEDMADNAQTFDALVTKTEGTTTDRLGVTRRVFQQILMDMGFQPLTGSFQTGAIITARNQALYDEVSQVFYAWGGALQKVVPVGSTPATAGGVGVGAWSDKTDLMLRGDLSKADGDSLTGYATYAQIRAYTGDKKSIRCGGRVSIYSNDGAHGKFYRDDTDTTSADDDGTILVDALDRRWKRRYSGGLNVKWYGSVGNWNPQTQTGADDTVAWQKTVNALGNTYRNGGYRDIDVPTGNYKIGDLLIPSILSFGVTFKGDGKYSSIVWGDQTKANIINSEIEFVHFDSIGLYGSLFESNVPANWTPCFYKGKLASNAPDIDVTFTNCALGYAFDFIQAYGRGVVVDNTCTCVQMLYLLNIVCDSSTVFDASSTNNKYQTGMRNYKLSPARADLVSRLFRVTGTAVQKDFINDIGIHSVDATGLDLLGEFPDATITQLNVTGTTALDSFAQGMLIGKRLISADIDVNAAKSFNRDAVSVSYITGLVNLTESFQNLKIKGTYRDLCRRVVNIGAESNGLDIEIKVNNIGMDGVNFVAVTGANVIGAKIDIFASGASPAGTLAFVASATQTSPKITANGHGFNFARAGASDTPTLYIGSTAQTAGYSATRYNLEKGKVVAEIAYFYTRVGVTASAVTLSLPPVTPIPEFPLLSSGISGMAIIKYSNLKTLVKCEISPSTGRVVFYKADGSSLLESDLPTTFTVVVHAEYPYV